MSDHSKERSLRWSKLSAGKRNALVHKHVFAGDFARACQGKPDAEGFCDWCSQIVDPERPHAIRVATPDYSGDIREAMQIVERYSNVQIHYMAPGTNRYGGRWMVAIDGRYRGLGQTMMEALCIAALESVGVEVE
jgi:hypothetical protein